MPTSQDDAFVPIAGPAATVIRRLADRLIERGVLTPQQAADIITNPDTRPASPGQRGDARTVATRSRVSGGIAC